MMADKASPTRAVLDKRLVVEIGIGWYLVGLVGKPVMSRPSLALGSPMSQALPKAAHNCT
jgi:hypothetical protein